jgi:putative ABC transport system substrate-binding protein
VCYISSEVALSLALGNEMRRRAVVVLLSQAAALWPLTALSQQTNRLPTIGFLGPDKQSWSSWIAAFENDLRKLGWIQGRTVAIEYRWSQGRPERVAEFATELVQQKVDVIVTYGGGVRHLLGDRPGKNHWREQA